jgi:hypothetical protein
VSVADYRHELHGLFAVIATVIATKYAKPGILAESRNPISERIRDLRGAHIFNRLPAFNSKVSS